MRNMLFLAVFLLVLGCAFAQTEQAPPSTAGHGYVYKEDKGGPMDTVLLKDYQPESSLVVPENHPIRAKFPVIDVHSHMGQCKIKTAEDVAGWVRTMDEENIEKIVVFTGAVGEDFDKAVEVFSAYPTRFQLWCSFDNKNIDDPDYSKRAVAELVRCYEKGARGLGEISDKGMGLQKDPLPPEKRLHVDDPRMDPIWDKCAELGIPVNLHIADHPSCWRPLGPNWERSRDFQAFNLYGTDASSYEDLLAQREKMLAKHPKTTFILCHLSNQGNDTASLAKILDKYPNAYLDVSAREYEIGRQPRTMPKFLEKYRDRVIFGTDMGRDKEMYELWWRVLETPDEYMWGRAGWRLYGAELPDDTLKCLYRDTAMKVLNLK